MKYDWEFAQTDSAQRLARLHYFSIEKKSESGGVIEFTITVKEFVTPKEPTMIFFAQADKQTNQNVAPYTPTGWGKTLVRTPCHNAWSGCVNRASRTRES